MTRITRISWNGEILCYIPNTQSPSVFVPFGGDVAGLDFVELVLDALLGSDLHVQGRLQLQTGRHVQLGEAPHLPGHVLQQESDKSGR